MARRSRYYARRFSSKAYRRRMSREKAQEWVVLLGAIVLIVFLAVIIRRLFVKDGPLDISLENVAAMRIPYQSVIEIKSLSNKYGFSLPEMLTYYSLENKFFPAKSIPPATSEIEQKFIINYESIKKKYIKKNITPYYELYSSLLNEIKYFPIAAGFDSDDGASYMYGDSWGSDRTYGGDRKHQGVDILDRENIRGRIPVVSMTNGIVKNIGWNELGGYRIGIEADSGNYYYYAHFDSFAENLTEGSKVSAGQTIGRMGDTGYGKKEGTRGNFQVHLHVGIMPKTSLTNNDFWINPYPFLRFVELNSDEGS